MKRVVVYIIGLILLSGSATQVMAIPSAVYNLSESGVGGLWSYSLSITNTSTEGENLYALDLVFSQEVLFTGLALPDNWDGVTWWDDQQTTSVDAFSLDPAFDLLPADTVDGFQFQTDTQLSGLTVTYDFYFTDPITSTVPEPSTLLLFALGAMGMIFLRRGNKG